MHFMSATGQERTHKKGKENAMKKFEIGKYYAPATSPSIEPLKCIKVTNCYVWFYDDEKECEVKAKKKWGLTLTERAWKSLSRLRYTDI